MAGKNGNGDSNEVYVFLKPVLLLPTHHYPSKQKTSVSDSHKIRQSNVESRLELGILDLPLCP